MYYTKEQRDKALNMILSPKGREWLAKRRVSQKVIDEALYILRDREDDILNSTGEMEYNCGGIEVVVERTGPALLLALILWCCINVRPMIVATATKRQEKWADSFKKLGFKQGPWVKRGDNGNHMCFFTLALDGSLSNLDRERGPVDLYDVLSNVIHKGPVW